MFDDLIDIFTLRNLFTPLTAFFVDLGQGPSVFFRLPAMAGFSKREVGQTLSQADIPYWGLLYDGQTMILSVRQEHAYLAHTTLTGAGMPVMQPTLAQATNLSQTKKGLMGILIG